MQTGKEGAMDNNVQLRRHQDNLNVCGLGFIILGAWSIIKVFMEILVESQENENFSFITLETDPTDKRAAIMAVVIIVVLVLIVSGLIFGAHFYIGHNACKAAKGEPYKKGYFGMAIFWLVLCIIGLCTYADAFTETQDIDITIASLLVDLTTIYILGVIVSSTVKIRKINEKLSQE